MKNKDYDLNNTLVYVLKSFISGFKEKLNIKYDTFIAEKQFYNNLQNKFIWSLITDKFSIETKNYFMENPVVFNNVLEDSQVFLLQLNLLLKTYDLSISDILENIKNIFNFYNYKTNAIPEIYKHLTVFDNEDYTNIESFLKNNSLILYFILLKLDF